MMEEIVSYILGFLLGEGKEGELSRWVGYTSDTESYSRYKVVVRPANFFDAEVYGTPASLPPLPLKEMEGMPVLFGEPVVEKAGDTMVVHADLVASTYFLITRYEEWVRRDVRDVHGRFPGRESLPAKGCWIDRPVVDEYGRWLRGVLRASGVEVTEPEQVVRKTYLTHDVDSIAHYRRWRGVAGAALKNRSQLRVALRSFFGGIVHDPWFTFPWLLQQNALLEGRAETIFFIKPGGGDSQEDQPHSHVESRDFRYLFQLLRAYDAKLGLHASYEAGKYPRLIKGEKEMLEKALGQPVVFNRHHYLDSREPEDMKALCEAGITDDFTMGYADVAGFRLGTCRPVRWINPAERKLTGLTLHPLTVMDGTLDAPQYMGLPESEAYDYTVALLNRTKEHGGDVCLLWHNTSVEKGYHRRLYPEVLQSVKERATP